MKKRRDFIKLLSIGGTALLVPKQLEASVFNNTRSEKILKFGICTDIHKDIIHDADSRLQAFIDEVSEKELDFIIQLGDFCVPKEANRDFMAIWNSYQGTKYHVIGNHDTDGGFTREETVRFWGAIGKTYSFDKNGYHFIILDGNDKNPSPDPSIATDGYARYLGKDQLKWLEKDLDKTYLPTIVFCHQGLDTDRGIINGTDSRLVLERANEKADFQKVQFVFSGHHHKDYQNNINGIHYIQINSMSYFWLGKKYEHLSYSKELHEKSPLLKFTVPYKDPIWAYVEISEDGTLNLYGKETEFVGPSPKELNVDDRAYGYPIVPYISDKEIKV